jgi:hypothetical protein
MLNDKVYLWLVITCCIALAVAGTLGIIELIELQDQTVITGGNPFAG